MPEENNEIKETKRNWKSKKLLILSLCLIIAVILPVVLCIYINDPYRINGMWYYTDEENTTNYVINISDEELKIGVMYSEYESISKIEKKEILPDKSIKLYLDVDFLDGLPTEKRIVTLKKTGINNMTLQSDFLNINITKKRP